MKRLIALFFVPFCAFQLTAQISHLSKQAIVQQEGNWVKFLPDARVEADRFFEEFQSDLGLDQNYHFEHISSDNDELGYTHHRYQEYFNAHPIEGGTYMLHAKEGFVTHCNGEIIRGLSAGVSANLTQEEGLSLAKGHTGAKQFYWEMPQMEERIKHIKNDPNASFFPKGELVYANSSYHPEGKDYSLAWKYELYTAQPDGREMIFVDASSGDILFALEGCHHGSVEGTAKTRYHGTQIIITDSVSANEFRLIDDTRGGGVETYDMNEQVSDYSLAVDFVDQDNYWDNANTEFNDAAADAHWGAEMFYDFFLQELGRDSYDDNGSKLVKYVHYDQGFFNAFWNGLFSTFGDGNDNPLTAIDVVAHEFTHGVTEFTAGLIYQNESGALNESFSDIFGTAVEFYGLEEEANWILGVENFALRDISNPNAFGDPDTYEGTSWYFGLGDNGGVHTNSGVQNFWFYLLANGGTGINDNSDAYVVDSLGMEKAAAIAYRNLAFYLTESSDYLDARQGSIQAAEDLYGPCSDEVVQVAKAWYAVGLGPEAIEPDLQVIEVLAPLNSSCDLGMNEPVSMAIRFNPSGCGLTIEAGDEIEVSYQLNSQDPVFETIVLSESISDGDIITHDFQTLADLSIPDQYFIDYEVNYAEDLISGNNEIGNHKVTNPLILEGNKSMAFEHFNAKDSLYVALGTNAEAAIDNNSENTGNKGFLMNSFGATLTNVVVVEDEADNYAANPIFTSKVCLCVDLSGWDEAYLNFDLRQTYSDWYLDNIGMDINYMIALRVLADDQQIGEQFHPTTNYSDPYLSHVMDMSEFAGTSFSLCFESVNFINEDEDEGNEGDKSTLDNVHFSQNDPLGIEEDDLYNVDIYPNPTSGLLSIEVDENGTHDLQVIDVLGKVVKEARWTSNGGPFVIDLSGLTKGIYTLSITSTEGQMTQKVVLD